MATSLYFLMRRVLVMALLFPISLWSAGDPLSEIIRLDYVLKVTDQNRAEKSITAWAEENGGYMQSLRRDAVTIRFSSRVGPGALSVMLRDSGLVVEESIKRLDQSERLNSIAASLAIKSKHLERLQALFSSSDLEQTVAVEKELQKVVQEIERLKGEERRLKEDIAYYTAAIRFTTTGVATRPSRAGIGWIDRLGLDLFLENF
ncbi:MAG: DUF4349 domain-containing protein [Spirochaetales bacterium]|nr:DUF4349 domain-containing protein [Spirochaetales bacterium]